MAGIELDHVQIAAPPGCEPARKAHLALRVGAAGLDRLAERLTTAGAPVTWDDALPGERRFYSADPWGNRIEFIADD